MKAGKLAGDIAYAIGTVGIMTVARWMVGLSTPKKDGLWLRNHWYGLTEGLSLRLRRFYNRWRVAVYCQLGYTWLRWVQLRKRWRKVAASE